MDAGRSAQPSLYPSSAALVPDVRRKHGREPTSRVDELPAHELRRADVVQPSAVHIHRAVLRHQDLSPVLRHHVVRVGHVHRAEVGPQVHQSSGDLVVAPELLIVQLHRTPLQQHKRVSLNGQALSSTGQQVSVRLQLECQRRKTV